MNRKSIGLATVNTLSLSDPSAPYRRRSDYRRKGHYQQRSGNVELKVKPSMQAPMQFENQWDYLRALAEGGRVPSVETVLPIQLEIGSGWRQEQKLMAAVLYNAIRDYSLRFTTRRGRRIAQEAETWMLSQDERWPFSFVAICAALNLDVGVVRARVLGPAL